MPNEHSDAAQTREYVWLRGLGENSRLRRTILDLFAIDLRTLALTRIVIASIVLIDLFARLSDLSSFYSDDGVIPRAAVYEVIHRSWFFSLYFLSGNAIVVALMFLISAVLAVMLLIGYRTRLVTFLTWLLFSSLIIRNPFVVHGGDSLLKMLLFWGIFLPWGASYSLDRALASNAGGLPKRVLSFATAGILLQMPIVYFFTGILKNGPEWRNDFTAILYTFRAPDFVLPVGVWLSSYPGLLKILTATTLVLEIAGAILLFSPIRTRTVRLFVCLAFVAFQLGLALTLKLELFPLVSTAALLPFIPSVFWDRLRGRLRAPGKGWRVYYDGKCGFCKKTLGVITTFLILPDLQIIPAQDDPIIFEDMRQQNSWVVVDDRGNKRFAFDAFIEVVSLSPVFWFAAPILRWSLIKAIGSWMYKRVAKDRGSLMRGPLARNPRLTVRQPLWMTIVGGLCLIFVVIDSLGSVARSPIRIPSKLGPAGQFLNIHQKWRMFAPSPLRSHTWYVVTGKLRNGHEVDLWSGGEVNWAKPTEPAPWVKNERWRTYMRFLLGENQRPLLPYFAGYVCRSWNEGHPAGEAVEQLALYTLNERITLDGNPGEVRKSLLWQQACGSTPGTSPRPIPSATPEPSQAPG